MQKRKDPHMAFEVAFARVFVVVDLLRPTPLQIPKEKQENDKNRPMHSSESKSDSMFSQRIGRSRLVSKHSPIGAQTTLQYYHRVIQGVFHPETSSQQTLNVFSSRTLYRHVLCNPPHAQMSLKNPSSLQNSAYCLAERCVYRPKSTVHVFELALSAVQFQ